MIWGINDPDKRLIGTTFDPQTKKTGNQDYILWLQQLLEPKIDFRFSNITIDGNNIVVLTIPFAKNKPTSFSGIEYIRIGSANKKLLDFPEKENKLWSIINRSIFETIPALENISIDEIFLLLDYIKYFRLTKKEIPGNPSEIIKLLMSEGFISENMDTSYNITNLAAILFANNLDNFSILSSKKIRFIQYDGYNKLHAVRDIYFNKGYALAFEDIINTIAMLVPNNEIIGGTLRINQQTYPPESVREFIANALIHQDFSISGNPTIELYKDRIEITNTGIPLIDPKRFIDEPPQRRNEKLCAFMYRINICENRGSGIDRALQKVEEYQLPPPNFLQKTNNMVVTIFAPKPFKDMDKDDRIRACYQHACLLYANGGRKLTNASLRNRFGNNIHAATISQIIGHTLMENLIKNSEDGTGRKNTKYIPFWA